LALAAFALLFGDNGSRHAATFYLPGAERGQETGGNSLF